MGLGLSFVVVILEHHGATLDIESEPLKGALFRVSFPLATEGARKEDAKLDLQHAIQPPR
jgi:signal transduction histidine kinase